MDMRFATVLGSLAVVFATGCGQSSTDELASSARDVTPADVAAGDTDADGPRRPLSPELAGDDPAFQAAIDAFDRDVLEARTIAVTGFSSNDLGGGYFGQKFFMSLWRPVSDDVAMRVCHALVSYANDIDFPATSISVTQKTYADLESSEDLVVVDDSGSCVAVGA